MNNWLIRLQLPGGALIWKRKFLWGMIAIPWALHGGTSLVRTGADTDEALTRAIEYINAQDKHPSITVTWS